MMHKRRRIMKKNSLRVKRIQRQHEYERANELFGIDQLLENYPLEDGQDEEYDPSEEEQQGGASLTDLSVELLAQLPKKDRMQLRRQFPTMPAYLFMSKKQKKKFFQKKYDVYKTNLAKQQLVRKLRHNKKVSFTNSVAIKHFKKVDAPSSVQNYREVRSKHSVFSTRAN